MSWDTPRQFRGTQKGKGGLSLYRGGGGATPEKKFHRGYCYEKFKTRYRLCGIVCIGDPRDSRHFGGSGGGGFAVWGENLTLLGAENNLISSRKTLHFVVRFDKLRAHQPIAVGAF